MFFLFISGFLQASAAGNSPKTAGITHLITIEDEISLGLAAYIKRSFAQAKAAKANAVILEIDTYGGRVDAAVDIVRYIEDLAPIPCYALVRDKAWSAGAMIALACKRIFMRPGSSIGSAAPVSGAGEPMSEKYVSALRAKFQALAEKNGYPPALAAAMVDKDLGVHKAVVGGKTIFLSSQELASRFGKGKSSKYSVKTIAEKGKLLNLTAQLAEEYGMAKAILSTPEDLLAAEGLPKSSVLPVRKTPIEHFVNFITSTYMAALLVGLAMMLITTEYQAPGFSGAGLIGLLILAFVFWGHQLANLAGWMEFLLVVSGLVLMAVEIFVIPGFGVCGVVGLICLFAGLYLIFVPFVIPREPWEFQRLKEVFWILAVGFFGAIAGAFALLNMIRKSPFFRSYPIAGVTAVGAIEWEKLPAGELATGQRGVSITPIETAGVGQFGIHMVRAASNSGRIELGQTIEIVRLDPGAAVVRKV
ncbi:MAG: hypothetical protein ABIG11_00520 [bacterium]